MSIKWDPSYSVNVRRCDEDHQKLFSMLNTLHESMLAGKGKEVVQQVVKQLADYAKFHFAAEEALMEKTKYPALTAHRAEHQAFVKKVEEFQADIAGGKLSTSVSVDTFLTQWLTKHIRNSDQKYGPHLNANGVN